MDKIKGKRILYAVLDWGLGHASRSIPLIKRLLTQNELWIGSNGASLHLLINEFPNVPTVELPAYNITYKRKGFLGSMLSQTPKIMLAMSKELDLTELLVDKYDIDLVISDHRLGCHSRTCKSVIMAHHIQIQTDVGFFGMVGSKVNKFFINQFDQCWIPDYENRALSLAGKLSESHGLKSPLYIGPLSRLKKGAKPISYDICVVLSGPEPTRSDLEKLLLDILSSSEWRVVFITGTENNKHLDKPNLDIRGLCHTAEITAAINASNLVIARSGYSTIMDMALLGKKALLIPTPGQTEQEFLALHLSNRKEFKFVTQDNLSSQVIAEFLNKTD